MAYEEPEADSYFNFFESYGESFDRLDDAKAGRLLKALCHYVFWGEQADFDDDVVLGIIYDTMKRPMLYSVRNTRNKRNAQKKSVESRKIHKKSASANSSANSNANCEEKRTERNGREEKFSSGSGRSGDAPEGAPLPALSDEEFAKLSLEEMNKYADADLTSEQVRIRGRERLWAYNDKLEERDRLGL